ncbi:5'-nucleotidase C-terminal domain-containing protein [Clostridium estertheticum]|uniref:5'-nucleotidase C-terminal domain-containing protein n=1 Tax=Clostridium estertheticum TaxID=238834 RepID=UPI0013E95509|nr:5'-nucleotidase C-terminal domain-containing protein [Clostridium estertheticum]
MTVTLFSSTLTMTAKAATGDKVFDIIEITDFHGTLLSSDALPLPVGSVLAKNLKDAKATNPDKTIIIGGGDLYQGSPISNVLRGVPVQKALSNIGMEVTALGNHEFDWQLDTIVNTTMKDAKYSIVAANLYNKNVDGTKGTRKFSPYKIIVKDGVKIAFIGAITAEAKDIIMPAYTDNYIFTDSATEINACAAEIKAAKTADVIVAIVHAGNIYDASYKDTGKGEIYDITNKLTNVNAVFGGHSHSIVTATGANGLPIYIANSAGKGYIDAKMTVQADGKVSFAPPASADYKAIDTTAVNGYKIGNPNSKPTDAGYVAGTPAQDPEVKAIVDAALTETGSTFSEVIGTAANDLTRTQVGSPYGESILGNWSSDVVRSSAKADIGIQNNGGLRTDIKAGPITVGSIFYFMPFDNEINTVLVTKAQLKVILEQAVKDGGKGIQISGIKFTYGSSAATGSRVFNITREDGTAISDTETLKLAGPDFILTGGDGFAGFTDVNVSKTMVKTGVLVRDALLANVRANNGIKYVLNKRLENSVKTISVIATSDLHGSILNYDYGTSKAPSTGQGLAKISTYVTGVRAANPNVMLVDNGDTIQGNPLVYYYNMLDTKTEYPMMKVMGAMKYDTWTLGNHEFNYGLTTLNRIISDANKNNINVLSANIYKGSTNYVKPYIVKSFTMNGKTMKVAILGLTTKNVPGWENPSNYAGLKFNDLVDEAKHWVPIIKAEGADYVIVTAHSGLESAADTTEENQINAIATKVSGIDAIVAGHVHNVVNKTLVNPDGKNVIVTEPGKFGQNISQIDMNFDAAGKMTLRTSAVSMNSIVEDPAIVAIAKPYQDKTLEYTNTVIGKSTAIFEGAKQLTEPSSIMELVNKVQMKYAGTQLSIAAPLSLTAQVPQGDVKRQDIMGVYVYENFLYGVKMTGKQVKDWMEYTQRYYKQITNPKDPIVKDATLNIADYNLDQLYGATYDIDLTQPAGTVDPVTKKMISGNRIKNLKVNGKLVKDSDVFTVAINNYRYNGGGGFMAAAGLSSTDPSIVTYDSAKALGDDGQVRSLMLKYIEDNKVVSPTNSNNWKIYSTPVTQVIAPPVVVVVPPVDVVPPIKKISVMTTAGSGLNFRATASASSKKLGVIKHGTVVQVIGQTGDWYKINYNGKVGYIYKAYTKVISGNVASAA